MAVNLDFTALDDAVLERLRSSIDILRTVETIAAEDQLTKPGSAPLPAAYTLINGVVYDPADGVSHYQDGEVSLSVFVKARNLRGGGEARKAPDGAYALIALVVGALLGYAPAGCGPLRLVDVTAFAVDKTNAAYAIKFAAETYEDY